MNMQVACGSHKFPSQSLPNLDLGRSFSLNWELTDSAMLIGQQVQGILLPLMASAMGLQVSP